MEKLARRTAMAERQVARRLAKQAAQAKPARFPMEHSRLEVQYNMAMARKARREDWEMGPLAPRRDVPTASLPRFRRPLKWAKDLEFRNHEQPLWGAVHREISRPTFKLLDWMKEERWAWAGGSKFPNLTVGDRVVVVEGAHKGQIAKIEEIDFDNASVVLEKVGRVNTVIPDQHVNESGQKVAAMPSVIPVSGVRLVHPITDPETGVTRDVVIKQLVRTNFYFDRVTRSSTWSRIVPGLNVRIPWPKVPPKEKVDHPADTLRIDAEKRTFVPTLLHPPIPEAVVDELRNKFSRFRTRHTDEYIAKIEAEEVAKRQRAKMADTMLTPLQEYNRMQREARKARGQPELSDNMLAKIGEVMARNRARAMAAAGISDVAVTSAPEGLARLATPPPPVPEPPTESHPPPS